MSKGDPNSNGPDLEALQLTREESRTVLDHQIRLLDNIDDKAMRTVRTAVILLGILASAAGIAGPDNLSNLPFSVVWTYGVATLLLIFTAALGIGVYTSSNLVFGVGESHRQEIRDQNYSEREWLNILINEYDSWIATMRSTNSENAYYLFLTQSLLAVSLASLFGGTVLLGANVYI